MTTPSRSQVDEDELLATARQRFEVTAFRPGQREVMQAVLAGRDVIGLMPTGAGKSLCYAHSSSPAGPTAPDAT